VMSRVRARVLETLRESASGGRAFDEVEQELSVVRHHVNAAMRETEGCSRTSPSPQMTRAGVVRNMMNLPRAPVHSSPRSS
jgi:hypothetical protein